MRIQITHFNNYGELGLSVDGRARTYYGVEAWDRKKIKGFIKRGHRGRLMQFMRQFSRPDIYEGPVEMITNDMMRAIRSEERKAFREQRREELRNCLVIIWAMFTVGVLLGAIVTRWILAGGIR